MLNIAVLISGGGTNLQAIIDAIQKHQIDAEIKVVISSSAKAYAVERAKKYSIPSFVVSRKEYESPSDQILKIIDGKQINLIVLAGYLGILKGEILRKYRDRIINIHPALLPKFGGPGMYGIHVHEAVLKAHEKESGCTVHYVNEDVDGGKIILQYKVPVLLDDTPESLAKRILPKEHIAIVEAIKAVQ